MASLEIVALDTATPQLEVPQSGDTYSAPRALAISPQSLTGSAATTSLDIAQTWNTTGTPTALKMNVTDTASNAASLLMDLQVGGTSRINASKAGALRVTNGTAAAPAISSVAATNVGFNFPSQFNIDVVTGGAVQATFDQGNPSFTLGATWGIAWGSSGITSPDAYIRRDNAANTLAQRNATNAQTLRVYNTYTSDTNYERGFLKWTTNILAIGTEKGSGGGTARDLAFQTDGTTRLTIGTTGIVTTTSDVRAAGSLEAGTSNSIYFNNRTVLSSSADGLLRLGNQSGSDFGRLQFGGTTSSFPALKRVSANLQVIAADNAGSAGLIVGNQALATTATDGFLYVPTCAGTPTGTPTAQTGTVPIVVDTTNNKLYFYSGAAWRDAGP